jgi:hypothetical protein
MFFVPHACLLCHPVTKCLLVMGGYAEYGRCGQMPLAL